MCPAHLSEALVLLSGFRVAVDSKNFLGGPVLPWGLSSVGSDPSRAGGCPEPPSPEAGAWKSLRPGPVITW